MIVRCIKCGNSYTVIENRPANITCQDCGSSEIQFQTNKKQLVLQCNQCKDYIVINPSLPFIGYHTKPRCKSSTFIIFPELKASDIPNIKNNMDDVNIKIKDKRIQIKYDKEVSVVVVCHNGIDLTKKCIDHLRKSSVPVEIILVDNDSDDDTYNWAVKQDDIIYIRNNTNLGCGIARNQGALRSSCDYILFLDNDQFICKDTIKDLLSVNCDLVGVESWSVIKSGATKRSSGIHDLSYLGAGGLLIKKGVFFELGGFDERFSPAWYEDVDFSLRAKLFGYKLCHVQTKIKHIGSSTITKQRSFDSSEAKRKSKKLFKNIWIDYLFKNGLSPKNIKPTISGDKGIPKILFIVDVPDWAWDIKAKQIIKYLRNEFDFNICYGTPAATAVYDSDICFTFEISQLESFKNLLAFIDKKSIVTGVTAHTYTNMRNFEHHLRNSKYIHANSILLYNEVKKYNSNCFYLPNGVDETLFKYEDRDITKPFTVGYVGKDLKRKGYYEFIVEACKRADVILKSQVCRYNSENKIDHEDMPKWYSDIDVIIIASDMDGTPNQLLEAASVGRTFVGNEIGNIPQFVNEGVNGFMVDRDVDAYVEKLLFLKENRERCKQMGIEARKTIEKGWTWKKQSENYRKMFVKIIKEMRNKNG